MTNPDPAFPLRRLPTPEAGSIRRTTTVDGVPDGTWEQGALLTGRGRDLVTDASGGRVATSNQTMTMRLDSGGTVRDVDGSADVPPELVGIGAGRGFRNSLRTLFPGAGEASLEAALLDDLPGMQIISGYARFHGTVGLARPRDVASSQIGVCHGWRSDGIAANASSSLVDMLADRPTAPELTSPDDDAWHHDPALAPDGMRRRRLFDVTPGDATRIYAYFRDTHQQVDGPETVLHEYQLHATIAGDPAIVMSLEAVPGSLPLSDCHGAAPGVVRIEGVPLVDIEAGVRSRLAGTDGCTHLNDLVRALRFVEAMTLAYDTATGSRLRQIEGDRP